MHAQGLAEEMAQELGGDLPRSAIDRVLAVVAAEGDRQAALAPDITR
jgi:serine/threonine-protein kinase HipA